MVRAVLMAKLGTEGGWMECGRRYGGIDALANSVECSRGLRLLTISSLSKFILVLHIVVFQYYI